MVKKETDTDHIWPTSEDGPDADWNKREIDPSINRSKGSTMPNVSDVLDSSNPIKLATSIDRHTIDPNHKYHTSRNQDRGFGGLKKI